VYHSMKGDISSTFPSNLLLKVEHLIIGLSFEISVNQGKCLLNVICPWVGNVYDMWNFWYSKEVSSKCHISFSWKCTWHVKFLILMEMPSKCHMSLSRENYRTCEISHDLRKFHVFLVPKMYMKYEISKDIWKCTWHMTFRLYNITTVLV